VGPAIPLFVACVAIWSTNWIAITTQIHAASPITALFWRFLLATVTLLAVLRWRRAPRRSGVPFAAAASVGVSYYFAGIGLTYLAARHLPSAYIACLSVTAVFFSMGIKAIVFRTPIAAGNVVGAAISATGLAVFFLDRDAVGAASPVGVALGLAAFLCVAIGAVTSEHLQRRYAATSLEINRGAIATACALYLAAALATGTSLRVPMTAEFLVPLAYLGVVCSALVFVLFIALIGRIGAEYAGYVSFVYPLAATFLSAATGEVPLRASMAAGSLLVVAGCVIGLKHARLAAARQQGSAA
jgi:drug/metabolite transporter (DMT)-like permease